MWHEKQARRESTKKAKIAKGANIVEATKNRGRFAEREAGACIIIK